MESVDERTDEMKEKGRGEAKKRNAKRRKIKMFAVFERHVNREKKRGDWKVNANCERR